MTLQNSPVADAGPGPLELQHILGPYSEDFFGDGPEEQPTAQEALTPVTSCWEYPEL